MNASDEYRHRSLSAVNAALMRGHKDVKNLREILIWTTSSTTARLVQAYFARHLGDQELVASLVSIALEGEDAGDAPWAAANTLTAFPPSILLAHREAIVELSRYDWDYLNRPAKEILSRLDEFHG